MVSTAGSASINKSGQGCLLYGSLETSIFGIYVTASGQRTFGDYRDLATITAVAGTTTERQVGSIVSGTEFLQAFDRVTVGVPLAEFGASFTFSYLHVDTESRPATHILSATYSQRLFSNMSFNATAFADLDDIAAPSVFVGLTIPLGGHGHVSTGFSHDGITGPQSTTTYAKALNSEPGSFGWRLRGSEGQTPSHAGAVSYRGSKAQGEVMVSQIDDDVSGAVVVDGAVAVAGGGVFLTNRIDDAFAVVDVGAPDVAVEFENRPAGRTDSNGRLLIPGLRSYQRNKITIDPENLPVNASIPTTKAFVVPADRSGVTVKFGVETETRSAVVVLTDARGEHLSVGSTGWIRETGTEFVFGYGGRAFIEHLSAENTARVALVVGSCSASFAYRAQRDVQVEIGPVMCQ